MKRILAAFIMAVLTHAALLAMGSKWLLCQTPVVPRTRVTTVRLVPRQPVGQPEIHPLPAAPLPLPPQPEPPPPPKPQVQKSFVQPRPIPKTPEKIVRPPEPTPPIVAVPTKAEPLPDPPAPLEEKPVAAFDAKPILSDSDTPFPAREPPGESSSSDTATTVVLAKPRYSQNPPPEYPSIARRRRYQGTVILEVFVLENGQVGDLRIAQSSNHSLLDRAAMKAVRRWQFDPARKGNREVAMWVKVPIRFDLK